jgi:lipoate---protein ligase
MIFIINPCVDPYFNVSSEAFLLEHFKEECFMLWRNSPSIIIGKHQNSLAEINYNYVNKNNIPVIRRLSGGGSVFHDLGNINFTFLTNNEQGKGIDFLLFLKPIVDLLYYFKIPVILNSHNNIFIGDRKISGTAAHLTKNRIIHHGTLLFKSSIDDLDIALHSDSYKYFDKSIKSVHSQVKNIYDYLTEKIEISEFMKLLELKFKKEFAINNDYIFKTDDIKKITHISEAKYKTWEWNYGYSPEYKFCNSATIEDIKVDIEIHVKKGIIEFIKISNDISTTNKNQIENALVGQPHEKNHLKKSIIHFHLSKKVEEKLILSFF